MTLKEAIEAGYYISDLKWERGYISRKINRFDQSVLIAGGRRKGQLYVQLPAMESTQYHYRAYLKKVEAATYKEVN